jgi:hypothetical protein
MAQVVNARLQTRSLFATSSPRIHWVVVLIGAWARAATERALDRILSARLKPRESPTSQHTDLKPDLTIAL